MFGVSSQALTVPDIDSDLGLMHTLFTLEDLYGMRVENANGEVHLCFDESKPTASKSVFAMLAAWAEQAEKYRNGEITKEQYDEWRYVYIKSDGSLEDGMEIVTHPMTLEYHLNEFCWEDILHECVRLGYRSHQTSTCGLHIHVNKNSLGKNSSEQDEVISRILYFVQRTN